MAKMTVKSFMRDAPKQDYSFCEEKDGSVTILRDNKPCGWIDASMYQRMKRWYKKHG